MLETWKHAIKYQKWVLVPLPQELESQTLSFIGQTACWGNRRYESNKVTVI
jgi:hypothetical protein